MAQPSAPDDRLAKLEKSMRFYRWTTLGLVIVVSVLALGQGYLNFTIPSVTRTRRLEVVNDKGAVIELSAQDSGGLMTISNEKGRARLLMGASRKGTGQVELHGANDERAALLWGTTSGGMLVLFNSDQKPVVDIQSDKKNCGVIAVNNYAGEYREGLVGDRR